MGVGAGLYLYVVVVQKFTFAISSPDEFLFYKRQSIQPIEYRLTDNQQAKPLGMQASIFGACPKPG